LPFVTCHLPAVRGLERRRQIRAGASLLVLIAVVCSGIGCGDNVNAPTLVQAKSGTETEPRIYVADWANHRIVRMNDMRGEGWITYEGNAGRNSGLHFPVGVCLDSVGRIYVSEQYHHRILRMDDILGTRLTIFSRAHAADKPVNKYAGSWICVDAPGRIYVTYDGEHRIVRMDDMQGSNHVAFGREGSGVGEFRYPAGIAVDRAGRIYVADFDNFRIVRIDNMEGTNWTSIGAYGSGKGQFINPCGIALDEQERIYVADQANDRIVRMDDMRGTNWTAIGSFGTGPEQEKLYAPTGICVNGSGRIYVTQSSSNHRIVRMDDMSGTNWIVFGSGGSGFGQFASPMGIAVQ